MSFDSLKVKENEDGSFTLEWDKDDPKWSFLNDMTSNEIISLLEEEIKKSESNWTDFWENEDK